MATAVADSYSAASGATLYAGRYPPDPGHSYIVLWGQSNAAGAALRTDIAASPLSADAGLATFDAGTFSRVYIWTGSTFAALQPSSNNGSGSTTVFGPEFGLAVRWQRETTAGNLYLYKLGISGAPISSFDPSEWPGSDAFLAAGTTIPGWFTSNAVTIAQRHWLWVQGESNASDTQSAYQVALQEIVDALYSESVMTTDSRLILAQMKVGSSTYGAGVDAAKAAIAAADPAHIKEVRMDYYQGDDIHCTGRGQVQLAYDAFERMFDRAHIAT